MRRWLVISALILSAGCVRPPFDGPIRVPLLPGTYYVYRCTTPDGYVFRTDKPQDVPNAKCVELEQDT